MSKCPVLAKVHDLTYNSDVFDGEYELSVSVRGFDNTLVKELPILGQVQVQVNLKEAQDTTYHLLPEQGSDDMVTGNLSISTSYREIPKVAVGPENFQILKLIGRGTYGQVYQVRKKDTSQVYAMKVLSKKVIVKHMEVKYALGERNILIRNATSNSPFVLGLKFAFQTASDLYLVTDLVCTII